MVAKGILKMKNLLIIAYLVGQLGVANAKDQKILRYCYTSWFGRAEPSDKKGPEVELIEAFAKINSMKAIPTKVTWEDLFKDDNGKVIETAEYLPKLMKSTCDIYATNMTLIDWRLRKFDMVPFHAGRIFIITTADRKNITTSQQLKGLKTAATPHTTLFESLQALNEELGEKNGFELKENPLGGTDKLLLARKLDFIALDASQALQVVREHSEDLRIAFPIGKNQTIGWAVSPKRKDLEAQLLSFVKEQKENPKSKANEIYKKYFGVSLLEYEKLLSRTQE